MPGERIAQDLIEMQDVRRRASLDKEQDASEGECSLRLGVMIRSL